MTEQPLRVEAWTGRGAALAAARLRGRPGLVWLDSSMCTAGAGRWSIVASDPRWTLSASSGRVRLEDDAGVSTPAGGAFEALDCLIANEPQRERPPAGLPFAGGAIGYLGFGLAREIECLPAIAHDDVGVPDLVMGWYDAALIWDGHRERGWLVGTAAAVRDLRGRLADGCRAERLPGDAIHAPAARLSPNMPRERYLAAVEEARRYIRAGDIYQVNLSQRFSCPTPADGFDLYGRLRGVSPAPFSAYLDLRAADRPLELLSSSPERFLLADGARLETRPIKGTRPRGASLDEDRRLADALLASEKDHAEHVMIVDLERNDLGRVAATGSVRVTSLARLESYEQVHHLTSTVIARRRPDVGLAALLRATFPGGSITGAPKIRALEIIDELEPTTRGVYTGAIGYVSAHGRLDLNIAIRTITLIDGVAHLQVGGAIVDDSSAEDEYAETLHKARGMARALGVRLPDERALPLASGRP